MDVAHRGQTLRQSVAHHHEDADAEDELLHIWRHIRTGRREEIWIHQTQLLAHQREDRLIHHLVFHVMLAAYSQGVFEQFALYGARILNLRFHPDIHLLPKAGYTTHTRRISLLE